MGCRENNNELSDFKGRDSNADDNIEFFDIIHATSDPALMGSEVTTVPRNNGEIVRTTWVLT